MQFQTNQPSMRSLRSLISRRIQITFLSGLLIGVVLGWAFSGFVGAIMRLGFLALLLIPLMLALFYWWNVRRAPKRQGTTVMTWGSAGLPPAEEDMFRSTGTSRPVQDEDVIDLDDLRRERKP